MSKEFVRTDSSILECSLGDELKISGASSDPRERCHRLVVVVVVVKLVGMRFESGRPSVRAASAYIHIALNLFA